MSDDTEFRSFVLEQLEGLGPFETRKMFGGLALLRDGRAFAKIKHGALWLKADDQTRSRFEDLRMQQNAYGKNNDRHLNFFQTPVDVLEDADQLSAWTEEAVLVAQRK